MVNIDGFGFPAALCKCKCYKTITVQYQTADMKIRIKTYTDWTAQIIQHEVDHCNGILI